MPKAIKYLNVELATQHKEIKFNLTRDLTLTFDSSLTPRGPNPNRNVRHNEQTNVYPNPNLTSSYIS